MQTEFVAISLPEPFATLICLGYLSTAFTLQWRTDYRGLLFIHSNSKYDNYHRTLTNSINKLACINHDLESICSGNIGHVIGMVKLIKCTEADFIIPTAYEKLFCGNFTPGHYLWSFQNEIMFKNKVKTYGRLKLYFLPSTILQEIQNLI